MLRPYIYKHSKIHKVQSFVNYIVLDILCKAPIIPDLIFSSNLVLPKYKTLIDEVNVEYIFNPLSESYRICKTLNSQNIKVLKRALHNNNRIRELCNGEIEPVLYDEIEKINPDLCRAIKLFCDNLYDFSVKREAFYNQFEKIEEYQNNLVGKSSVCRCCGINKVLTKFHTHRSALDHYLPRQHYPFTSINFRNLIPICDTCNSKYKLGENTLFEMINIGRRGQSQKRVKAFYPYRREVPEIKIGLKLNKPYNQDVKPNDFEISLSCTGYEEQVNSWERMFGIKENYLAECCTEEMYSYFEEQYMAEMNYGKSHDEYIEMLSRNKYGDVNFLKIPFLNAVGA
jgi:hypothetical protein